MWLWCTKGSLTYGHSVASAGWVGQGDAQARLGQWSKCQHPRTNGSRRGLDAKPNAVQRVFPGLFAQTQRRWRRLDAYPKHTVDAWHAQAHTSPDDCALIAPVPCNAGFRMSELQPPARVSQRCSTQYCACQGAKNPTHIYFTAQLQYMLAIMSREMAQNRACGLERMKGREYRELRKFKQVFLHRVADSRERAPKGERAQFDCEHWREVKTMTMFAGRWQICVPVHVLGTVASVREEYKTEGGVQVADDAVTQTTTVVIQCHAKPDEIELLYVQKDKGRRRATAADLAGVRHTVAQQQGRLVL
jgi:hypothetical protein